MIAKAKDQPSVGGGHARRALRQDRDRSGWARTTDEGQEIGVYEIHRTPPVIDGLLGGDFSIGSG